MTEAIRVRTTESGDEWISPGAIFVVREPDEYFRQSYPKYKSYIKAANYQGHSIDGVDKNIPTVLREKFIRLSAPSGQDVWVNASADPDLDEPNAVLEHEKARSVLRFGPGADAPRQALRQTREELIAVWEAKGWSTERLRKP